MNTTIINNTAAPSAGDFRGAGRRVRFLLFVSLLPLVFSGLLTGVFYILGDYRIITPVPATTEFASIDYPQKGKPVGEVFVARGTLTKLPEDTVAYLMVRRDQSYWPKKYLGNTPGVWSKEIREAKRKNSQLSVVILALGATGKAVIDQWYLKSQQTGKYPGLTAIPTAREIARIGVKQ